MRHVVHPATPHVTHRAHPAGAFFLLLFTGFEVSFGFSIFSSILPAFFYIFLFFGFFVFWCAVPVKQKA
jgi:hypothetical protein